MRGAAPTASVSPPGVHRTCHPSSRTAGAATAAAFPAGEKFLELMDRSGAYRKRVAHPLTFGTAFVYVGTVA